MAIIDRAKELAGYLMAGFPELNLLGYPLTSACAVVGNAWRENLIKPVTEGVKDHGSDGLFQWRLERLTGNPELPGQSNVKWGMQPWCIKHFGDWKTIKAQSAFFLYEVARDYKVLDAELKAGTKSIETMTANICDVFERPSVEGRALGFVPGTMLSGTPVGRINYAYMTLDAMKGVIPTAPPIQVPVHPPVATQIAPAPGVPTPTPSTPSTTTLSGALAELHRLRSLEEVQIAIIQSHLHELFEILK